MTIEEVEVKKIHSNFLLKLSTHLITCITILSLGAMYFYSITK